MDRRVLILALVCASTPSGARQPALVSESLSATRVAFVAWTPERDTRQHIRPMLMRSPLARDRRRPPGFIPPCQPVIAERVPAGDGWLHELKHDGFRIIARKEDDS